MVDKSVKEIEKRINEEPGFQVNKVVVSGNSSLYTFHMNIGELIVRHVFSITPGLPRPDDVVAFLRDEYAYILIG